MAGRDRELDLGLVCDVYEHLIEEFGRGSCQLVAEYLHRKGLSNYEGKPYSRQAIHQAMNKTQRGRELLQKTKKRINR